MPTTDRDQACKALRVLYGAMGRDQITKEPLYPSHHDADHPGQCSGLCECGQRVAEPRENDRAS